MPKTEKKYTPREMDFLIDMRKRVALSLLSQKWENGVPSKSHENEIRKFASQFAANFLKDIKNEELFFDDTDVIPV